MDENPELTDIRLSIAAATDLSDLKENLVKLCEYIEDMKNEKI